MPAATPGATVDVRTAMRGLLPCGCGSVTTVRARRPPRRPAGARPHRHAGSGRPPSAVSCAPGRRTEVGGFLVEATLPADAKVPTAMTDDGGPCASLVADDQQVNARRLRGTAAHPAGLHRLRAPQLTERKPFPDVQNALDPDVILMDVRMPGIDGIEATRQLAAASAGRPRVLILTTFDLDEYVYDALRAGATGFLLKDVHAEQQLFGAVRIVRRPVTPSWHRRLPRRLITEFALLRPSPDAPTKAALARLTPRETQVLRLVAEGLSNPEIALRLFVTEETVKTHVSRILNKLGLRDRTQAVVTAYESGLAPSPSPTPLAKAVVSVPDDLGRRRFCPICRPSVRATVNTSSTTGDHRCRQVYPGPRGVGLPPLGSEARPGGR